MRGRKQFTKKYNKFRANEIIKSASISKSLEAVCSQFKLKPSTLIPLLVENKKTLPELEPYRHRPEIDVLIDEGLPQEWIAEEIDLSKERVRQYLHESLQYDYWKDKNEAFLKKEKENKKGKRRAQESLLGVLSSILATKINKFPEPKKWAHKKAIEYVWPRNNIHVPFEHLVTLFERYYTAKSEGKKLSLGELTEGTNEGWHIKPTHASYILRKVGLEPMYGSIERHITPKDKKEAMNRATYIKMPSSDKAYFLGLPPYIVAQHFLRQGKRQNPGRFFKKGYNDLRYKLASQIYAAQDFGFNLDEIVELYCKGKKITEYAIKNRHKIEKKIISALRLIYNSKDIDKPYIVK